MINQTQPELPPYEEIHKDIVFAIVLSVLTFGIYYFFWQAHQMRAMNRLLNTSKYGFWKWFFLSILTFGLYHLYYEYVMGSDLVLIQKKYSREQNENLPMICLLLGFFGLVIVADAIQQYELHKLYIHRETVGLPL